MTRFKDAEQAVRQFHEFLQGWLSGALPRTDAVLDAAIAGHHEDFLYHPPEGEEIWREDLREMLWKAHRALPNVKIEVTDFEQIHCDARSVIFTYKEVQRNPASVRRSCTVFIWNEGEASIMCRYLQELHLATG